MIHNTSLQMSEITIGSFGEQTLDALLEAEDRRCNRNNAQHSKIATESRAAKSTFVSLRKRTENVIGKLTTCNVNYFQKHDEEAITINDTNVDKYFQDSIALSKIVTLDLEPGTDSPKVTDGVSKKKTCPRLSKMNNSNKNHPEGKRAQIFQRRSTQASQPTKMTKIQKSRHDGNLPMNVLVIESLKDEYSSEQEKVETIVNKHLKEAIASNATTGNSITSVVNKATHFNKKHHGPNSTPKLSISELKLQTIAQKTHETELIDRKAIAAQIEKFPDDKENNLIIANSKTIFQIDLSKESSIVSMQDRCKLSAWGVPSNILQKYESRGMGIMFPWQMECLSNYQVLENNKNLIYSAPTSAGKTLVAEILIMKTVLERQKKVIFILPFVSVVREKMFYFQDLLSSSGVRVEGFMGGNAPAGGLPATHIAIATIEKANSLINRLMEEGGLSSLGAVVVDELHLLGDPHRGYLLELLLTKLKYMTLREEQVNIQLIGMSATLPNLSLLAEWLGAELFKTEFRPIALNEQYKINRTIYNSKFMPTRELHPIPELCNDPDQILQLCIETIADGHSTLIFCPTKNWCENLAHQVAAIFFKLGSGDTTLGQILRKQLNSDAIAETLCQLERCPAGLDNVLKGTVSFGVAFHHAGLTMDERDIIECSFRIGSLRVLIATSTLSSGVNLPARRVIIRSLVFHGKVIDTLTYRQMIGRAGRMGKDTAGESILICKPNEKSTVKYLLAAPLDPVRSCLEGSGPLVRALLEVVASGVACTSADIDLYSRCTLASFQPKNNVQRLTQEAMEFLTLNEFIIAREIEDKQHRWMATALGKACLASSVPPSDGLFLFEELQRARKSFVLETDLHIIYLVTPFNSSSLNGQIDWMIFFNLWKSLTECEQRVGRMVGIEEKFLVSAIRGLAKPGKKQSIHRRFFTALALHDLVKEVPLTTVSEKYGCSRGILQSLQQSASTFAGMVTQFCKQLGWDCMELLFCQFQVRLQFGVCRELLDLLRLPMLNGLRARSLYKDGIKCVADLATANELAVERALHKALPFESEKEQDGEHMLETAKRNKVRSIFITGRDGLTPYQAAVMLVQEARTLVQHELGIKDVYWQQGIEKSNSCLSEKSYQRNRSSSSDCHVLNPAFVNNKSSIQVPVDDGFLIPDSKYATNSYTGNSIDAIDSQQINKNLMNTLEQLEKRATTDSTEIDSFSKAVLLREQRSESNINVGDTQSQKIQPKIHVLDNPDSIVSSCSGILKSINPKNQFAKNKPKFKLLSTKRRIRQNDDNATSVYNDNLKQNNSPTKPMDDSRSFVIEIDEKNQKTNVHKMLGANTYIHEKADIPDFNLVERPKEMDNDTIKKKKKTIGNSADHIEIRIDHEPLPKQCQKTSLFNDDPNASFLGSPSLFGDSLSLDTQFCDDLEKNINSSVNIGKDTNTIDTVYQNSSTYTPNSTFKVESGRNTSTMITKRNANTAELNLTTKTISSHKHMATTDDNSEVPYFNQQILNSEEINFSWNSTTWDNPTVSRNSFTKSNGIRDQACQVPGGPKGLVTGNHDGESYRVNMCSGNLQKKCRTVMSDLNLTDEIAVTPPVQNSRFKSVSPESNSGNIHDVKMINHSDSRKRQFNEAHSQSDSSPVLKVLNISSNRRLSFESNKSDSDDYVVASQNLKPTKNTEKSRARLKLELSRRVALETKQSNPTLEESRRQSNIVTSRNIELLRTGGISSKKVLYQENCSTDSIVSNTDEDSPVARFRVTQNLHQRSLNSSIIVQKVTNSRKRKKKCLRADSEENRISSNQKSDWNILDIINVAWDDKIFNLFSSELKGKSEIAIALAQDKFVCDTFGIGSRLVGGASGKRKGSKKNESCIYSDTIVNGVAISWGRNVVYYISFENKKDSIPLKERLQLLRDVLTNSSVNVRCYGSKDIYKTLHLCCNISSNCTFLDPQVAEWLLEPDLAEKKLNDMASIYFPQGVTVLQHAYSAQASVGFNKETERFVFAKHKAAAEAAVTWYITGKLIRQLRSQSMGLAQIYKDVECKVASTLARLELTGIGINLESLRELSTVLQRELMSLEQRAFALAGRRFSFNSPKEVAQVLGMYKGIKVSTNKAVLENCSNPISNLVVSWRKLNATQTKMVFPLLSLAHQGSRVQGCCVTRTATGRISMHEPNLQNVPRDFSSEDNSFVISMRMAFVPTCGNIILSADYCQLELRILAHFSKDPVLCEVMRRDADIFRNIAARWNHISVEEVQDDLRQRTKQLCYGIIYGIGPKALAKQLSVTELEAGKFMETFLGTYPNVRTWLSQVTTESRENGYVITLMERRRKLPGLYSDVKSERSHAERQAVNTKIQGSAADLAKKAMVLIDERLHSEYPDAPRVFSEMKTRKLRSSKDCRQRGAYLVLQLHDELLYEVNAADLDRVAVIVKTSMEEAYQLYVPLPVKIKVGPTWGSLTEYKV
ncbi:DNA polymerase theta isoform X2 [Athalia rosae]|uniref:DNA polymerase theta isoform X2 n=1 Tax=Athalia rosae TaxID=37344 RepID=UPI002033A924|nr:DNA polymerase theta isoform X2 [Athalia rosae]